jgi:hypothetical protein
MLWAAPGSIGQDNPHSRYTRKRNGVVFFCKRLNPPYTPHFKICLNASIFELEANFPSEMVTLNLLKKIPMMTEGGMPIYQ